jgi:16S rRNA (guanine966-N2)-methyltransferase
MRATTDRAKEALFSMVESLLAWGRPEAEIGTPELWAGLWVADVYAGSGALGIEALSRGAAGALFVEASAHGVAAIAANLRETGMTARATVLAADARRAVATIEQAISLVLMDPPYDDFAALAVVEEIGAARWLVDDAIIALEHSHRLAAPDKLGTLRRQRDRRHGDTALTIYARGGFDRISR